MKKQAMIWMAALACAGLFASPAFAKNHGHGKAKCSCNGDKGEKCTCKKGCKCKHKDSEEKPASSGT